MRHYGVIYSGYWRDPDIAAIGGVTREFGAYLLTGPHSNGLGCFYLPPEYVAADLGWDIETVQEAFVNLSMIGFIKVCPTTKYVFIPKFLKWNEITNPNVAKGRFKELASVPKNFTHYSELLECMKEFGKHWPRELEKALANPSLIQQEPEPEQEPKRTAGARPKIESRPTQEPAQPTRGTRFKRHQDGIPKEWIEAASQIRPDLDAAAVYESFCDHWVSKPGQYGLKLDWLATWRNWLRKEPEARVDRRRSAAMDAVPDHWWKTDEGVRAKALELEVTPPKAGAPGEWLLFKARVIVAAGEGPWVPDDRDVTLHRAVQWVRKNQGEQQS